CTTCSGCCDYHNTMVNGVATTLGPGVYCGGITVGPSANVTFLPGTYVLMGDKTGGGLTVKGNSTVQGNGVTFYNTATAAKNFQPFSVTGGTVGSLSAPTSGPMESMLFFQDRTFTANVTN